MPELPEVETIRRGIEPHVVGRTITRVVVRDPRLRWPVPRNFARTLTGGAIRAVQRRGKYLLLDVEARRGERTDAGHVILHMGMTGRLSVLDAATPVRKHDHLDLELSDGRVLRFNDSRRFGAALWWPGTQPSHVLLRHMGPEPLDEAFNSGYLLVRSRGRRARHARRVGAPGARRARGAERRDRRRRHHLPRFPQQRRRAGLLRPGAFRL
jgi:formamidopyrimidine-DNA glycosylase